MDEVRLYEMYLNEAIEERKADLINRNEDYKNLRAKFNDIMNKYPNCICQVKNGPLYN